jgi:hypothetical protein
MTIDIQVARNQTVAGLYRVLPFKATGPSSYATGGHAVKTQFPFEPEVLPDLLLQDGASTRLAVYEYDLDRYVIYVPNTGAEVANGTDLSTFTARGVAWGK